MRISGICLLFGFVLIRIPSVYALSQCGTDDCIVGSYCDNNSLEICPINFFCPDNDCTLTSCSTVGDNSFTFSTSQSTSETDCYNNCRVKCTQQTCPQGGTCTHGNEETTGKHYYSSDNSSVCTPDSATTNCSIIVTCNSSYYGGGRSNTDESAKTCSSCASLGTPSNKYGGTYSSTSSQNSTASGCQFTCSDGPITNTNSSLSNCSAVTASPATISYSTTNKWPACTYITVGKTGYNGDSSLKQTPDNCTLINYNITYNLDGGSCGANGCEPTSYNIESADITLPTPTLAYHTFDGWYANQGLTGSSTAKITTGSTGDKTFYAKWVKCSNTVDNDCTITWKTNANCTIDNCSDNATGKSDCKLVVDAQNLNHCKKCVDGKYYDGNKNKIEPCDEDHYCTGCDKKACPMGAKTRTTEKGQSAKGSPSITACKIFKLYDKFGHIDFGANGVPISEDFYK
jgi:uncharacterized repeat protein (TIGR02543 family)